MVLMLDMIQLSRDLQSSVYFTTQACSLIVYTQIFDLVFISTRNNSAFILYLASKILLDPAKYKKQTA